MAPFHFAICLSTTGQVYDLSHHFQCVEWINRDNNGVTVLGKVHDRWSQEAVGHLIGDVHKRQKFTLVYGPSEHAWSNRKARVVLIGVPINYGFEFIGEEWFGPYY